MSSLLSFLLGCLCGFVGTILTMFLLISLKLGGDKDE